MKRSPGPCCACGAQITGKASWALYCHACSKAIKAVRRPIMHALAHAIQYHGFPHPREFQCVDCGRYQAQFYEHRDYFKPLDVEPVCGSCNAKRGPAQTLINNVEHITLEAA